MSDAAPSNPIGRRRRWVRRAALVLIGALLILIGVVQVILWTDLPRRRVVLLVERQLGLRISAAKLSAGWFGQTTLSDVTVSLPLSAEPLATAPTMRVSHTWLPALLLGGDLSLKQITIAQPQLVIRQNAGGRWNVQDAVELIVRATGGRSAAAKGATAAAVKLPALQIDGAAVRVIDNRSREARIEPVDATGASSGPLLYRYALRVPDRAAADGEFVPGGFWQHEIRLVVSDADEWIKPFIEDWQGKSGLDASWRGRQDGNGALRGRLDIRSLVAGEISASGVAVAGFDGERVTVKPQRLLVQTGQPAAPEVRIETGTIALDATALRAESVQLTVADGEAEVSGTWSRTDGSADLNAQWRDLRMFQRRVAHSGTVKASLRRPWPGAPRIDANIASSGALPDGITWTTDFALRGEGPRFGELDWIASIRELTYTSQRSSTFQQITAHLQTRDNIVTLQDINAADVEHLTGRGRLDLRTRDWWLWLSGANLRVPGFAVAAAGVEFDINAWGMDLKRDDGQTAHYSQVEKIYLRSADVEASALGTYDAYLPRPVQLDVWVTHLPDLGREQSDFIRGRLRSDAHLVGTLAPLQMDLTGRLLARDLVVNEHPLGDVRAAIDGSVTPDSVTVQTRRLKLFGGEWSIACDWPTSFPETPLDLSVAVSALPLNEAAELFGARAIWGVADASFSIKIAAPALDRVNMTGQITARDVVARDFSARTLTAQVAMRDGTLRLDPIVLQDQDGRITASAESVLAVTPAHWQLGASAARWPVNIPRLDGAASVSGETKLALDLRSRAANGPLTLRADIARRGEPLASAQLSADLDGRTLRCREIVGEAFGGTFTGSATYDLDAPRRTISKLEWQNIDVAQLVSVIPRLDGAVGRLDGNFAVAPSSDPRALGPLRLSFSTRGAQTHYRRLEFLTADVVAFADVDRIVTDSVVIRAADGNLTGFARVTRRPDVGIITGQLILELDNLSLDQVVHAGEPAADPMPGRLGGSIRLAGELHDPAGVFGDVRLTLDQSDLANLDSVAMLYNLMHVGSDPDEPTGHGFIRGHVEGNSLDITNGRFFNRGVEVRGVAKINGIFGLPDSPIDGMLVGSARPLNDIKLPFFADVDQILAAVQANVTTVHVAGTVRQPQVRVATFAEIGAQMQKILLGEATAEKK